MSLNGILLCVSGSEALFADMGHFSHRAISVSALPEEILTLYDLDCMALLYIWQTLYVYWERPLVPQHSCVLIEGPFTL